MLTRIVESQALKFPHNDNDPFRIFGLPRNILVEVCAPLHLARVLFDCLVPISIASSPSPAL